MYFWQHLPKLRISIVFFSHTTHFFLTKLIYEGRFFAMDFTIFSNFSFRTQNTHIIPRHNWSPKPLSSPHACPACPRVGWLLQSYKLILWFDKRYNQVALVQSECLIRPIMMLWLTENILCLSAAHTFLVPIILIFHKNHVINGSLSINLFTKAF